MRQVDTGVTEVHEQMFTSGKDSSLAYALTESRILSGIANLAAV